MVLVATLGCWKSRNEELLRALQCPELRRDLLLPRKAVPCSGVPCLDSLLPGSVEGMEKLFLLLGICCCWGRFLHLIHSWGAPTLCGVRNAAFIWSSAVLSFWVPVTGRTGRGKGADCVKLPVLELLLLHQDIPWLHQDIPWLPACSQPLLFYNQV